MTAVSMLSTCHLINNNGKQHAPASGLAVPLSPVALLGRRPGLFYQGSGQAHATACLAA